MVESSCDTVQKMKAYIVKDKKDLFTRERFKPFYNWIFPWCAEKGKKFLCKLADE